MKVLDRVWMLVNDEGVIYCIGNSAKEVWQQVVDGEMMGTGVTKEILKDRGYRAKKVMICEE